MDLVETSPASSASVQLAAIVPSERRLGDAGLCCIQWEESGGYGAAFHQVCPCCRWEVLVEPTAYSLLDGKTAPCLVRCQSQGGCSCSLGNNCFSAPYIFCCEAQSLHRLRLPLMQNFNHSGDPGGRHQCAALRPNSHVQWGASRPGEGSSSIRTACEFHCAVTLNPCTSSLQASPLGGTTSQGTDASGTKDVFLYNKSHLRLHGEPAPVEIARPLAVDGETCQTACPYSKSPTRLPMLSRARCVQSRPLQ